MTRQQKNRPDTQLPVLAVDIGNTRAHIGIVQPYRWRCVASTAFPTTNIAEKLGIEIRKLCAEASQPVPRRAAVSSVVASGTGTAVDILTRSSMAVTRITPSVPFPLDILYSRREDLGDDRIANALYCITKYPDRCCIVISAGTALTIDCIKKGVFRGGSILPGLTLQFESLGRAADALPKVTIGPGTAPVLPGRSTVECVTGGVMYGTAAAISGIVTKYTGEEKCGKPVVLATGGDWEYLSSLVSFECSAVPDLTLVGTATVFNYIDGPVTG